MVAAPVWQWSDAWLFEAVAWADGAPLRTVIAAGDAINRAVFERDELVDGAARLHAAGLVDRNAGAGTDEVAVALVLTEDGAAMHDRSPHRDALKKIDWLLGELRSIELDALPAGPLVPADADDALAAYLGRE